MKYGKTGRVIIGLATVYVFFIVTMCEATRPIRIHPPRPDRFQTFTRETHAPSPEFLVALSHKRPWEKLELSPTQQTQLDKEFREFLLTSLEIRQEIEHVVSSAASRAKAAELHQQLAQRFARHLAAIHKLLTPEQRGRLAEHGKAKKTVHLLTAQSQLLLPVQNSSVMNPGLQSQCILAEKSLPDMPLFARAATLRESLSSPRQHLYQLEMLRI